jgi:FlaA1/EpsC-like NDP-sugar epimerase
MERYFMTIPEASQLVLQAAAMGRAGEIFVLDMGKPVKIVDLVNDMLYLSGLRPGDLEIRFTGIRPGEKLTEELRFEDEEVMSTSHPKICVAHQRPYGVDEVRQMVDDFRHAVASRTDLLELMRFYVPEFQSTPAALAEADDAARLPAGASMSDIDGNSDSHLGTTVILH